MPFAEVLEQYLCAREKLLFEENKWPSSSYQNIKELLTEITQLAAQLDAFFPDTSKNE